MDIMVTLGELWDTKLTDNWCSIVRIQDIGYQISVLFYSFYV